MHITKQIQIGLLAVAFMAALLIPLVNLRETVSAAVDTCTWTGSGDGTSFSDGTNWSGCDNGNVPENGDTLVFDSSLLSGGGVTLNNDLTGLSVAGISTTGTGDEYTITGNNIVLTGELSATTSSRITLDLSVALGSNVTLSSDASGVTIGSYNTTDTFDLSTFNLNLPSASGQLVVYSNLSGSGNIVISGGELIQLENTNSAGAYTGDVSISDGLFSTFDGGTSDSGSITVSNLGTLNLATSNGADYGMPITLGSSPSNTEASLVYTGGLSSYEGLLSGGVTLTSNVEVYLLGEDLTIDPFDDGGFEISVRSGSTGNLNLPSGAVESKEETITINESDVSSAVLFIGNKQTYIVNGERGGATVNSGGVLKGTGTFTGVVLVASGGVLAPGLSPGCLTISSGGLTILGTYQVELEGEIVCDEYDQTDVTGSVNVTGATLDLQRLSSYVPELNTEFVIINNDAADAVTGEFTGWAQGAQVVVDQVTYEIDYAGGDGNDVVLTVVAIDSALAAEAGAPDTGLQSILASPYVGILALVLSGMTLVFLRKKQLI